jgi:hypothetical protein
VNKKKYFNEAVIVKRGDEKNFKDEVSETKGYRRDLVTTCEGNRNGKGF